MMSSSVSGVGGAQWSGSVSGASWSGPPQQKMSSLYDKIDPQGSGSVTASQLAQAFQNLNPPKVFQNLGPEATFAKLDTQGRGQVSREDFVNGMKQLMVQLRQDTAQLQASQAQSIASSSSLLGKTI
jgi:hypothetical protein